MGDDLHHYGYSLLVNDSFFNTRIKQERERVAVIPRIFASIGGLTIGTFGLTFRCPSLGRGNDVKGFELLAVVIAAIFIV